jgi:hypothetical protein
MVYLMSEEEDSTEDSQHEHGLMSFPNFKLQMIPFLKKIIIQESYQVSQNGETTN